MLRYLVILLDDTSVSYCHYRNERTDRKLIALDDLKAGIFFAMKEILLIQFVYPDYELPQEYKDAVNSIDHSKIVPFNGIERGDIWVIDGWNDCELSRLEEKGTYVLTLTKNDFFANVSQIKGIISKVFRLNVVLTDIDTFGEDDFKTYNDCLHQISQEIEDLYSKGRPHQFNLLTDRMVLDTMNNCNAGWENITLAPDGKFYVCPAFYQANSEIIIENGTSVLGDLRNGINVKNQQLFKLEYSPLCRKCDAHHCKRCVWMNRKTTFEVNTPSHEQCVVAHIERNESRTLLNRLHEKGVLLSYNEIKQIDYLDPFDICLN